MDSRDVDRSLYSFFAFTMKRIAAFLECTFCQNFKPAEKKKEKEGKKEKKVLHGEG